MPNYCNNYLKVISDDLEKIETICSGFKKENSFEAIIGRVPHFPPEDWYIHNITLYGVKWDISPDEQGSPPVISKVDGRYVLEYYFVTAWNPPFEFFKKMSGMYNVTVEVFYCECGMDFSGLNRWKWEDGYFITTEKTWGYNQGLYINKNDNFIEDLIDYQIQELIEEEELEEVNYATLTHLLKQRYPFMKDIHIDTCVSGYLYSLEEEESD
jgi:hypothetical protein